MACFMKLVRRFLLAVLMVGLVVGLSGSFDAKGQAMAPPLEPNLGWLNTDRALRLDDELAGHVVLLDFWTFCCINCHHVLPDLEYLEEKYADEPFIVVGVHSAKFTNEATRRSIRNAMFRYDISHPVVIDDGHGIWSRYGVRSWPTLVLIGADGRAIGSVSGEGNRAVLDRAIGQALVEAKKNGTLSEKRVEFKQDAQVASASGLAFPGKVLADREGDRLFVADSSHDRVVVAHFPDDKGRAEVISVIGDGVRGLVDGGFGQARFNDPQGMALTADGKVLFIADTNNHVIRKVDFDAGTVETIAGRGEQVYDRRGGGEGTEQGLNSPWDVELSADGGTLYIAMAGPHQIWSMDLESMKVGRFAGSGSENIVDGGLGVAALAQPSDLALSGDGKRLYFADSETSSVRYVDLEIDEVRTIVGTGLFDYGDVDGVYPEARLQHCLGVDVMPGDEGGEKLIVADTYNSRVKRIDVVERSSKAWVGGPAGGEGDWERDLMLDEPGDVDVESGWVFVADTNNHRVVMVELGSRDWMEVQLVGLNGVGENEKPDLEGAIRVQVAAGDLGEGGQLTMMLTGRVPEGHHPNIEAPTTVVVRDLAGMVLAQRTYRTASFPVEVELEGGELKLGREMVVELSYGTCADDASVCTPGWTRFVVEVVGGGEGVVELGG